MKIFKLGLIFSMLSLFVFACTQTTNNTANSGTAAKNDNTKTVAVNNSANTVGQTTPPDELAVARKIYAENCVACHKENGEGGMVDSEGKKFKVPSYKSDKAKNASDEKLLGYIVDGDDEMPSFKAKLTDDEMKSLVKFIRREFQGK